MVRDPLGLAAHARDRRRAGDEVLVLPRVEPVRAPGRATAAAPTSGRGLRAAGAEAELDGLRVHRPGAPASRIAWQVYARSGELHERSLRAGGDSRPLVVLDLSRHERRGGRRRRGARRRLAGRAPRRARRLRAAAARASGGRWRSTPGLRGWPHAHARLALAEIGGRPQLAALGRGGPVR